MINKTDIAIIGAGPIGIFTIFEAGMLKMKCQVIDSLDFLGGQCQALYPEKPIYDIPAHPSIEAAELISKLELQAAPFKPIYHLNQQVTALVKQNNDSFLLTTSKNNIIEAKSVIIAAGCGAFGPNRPPLANIEQYENNSIFYAIRNKESLRDKVIVIAGGGDSAVDWALSLVGIAKYIYLVHRREKFKCAPESLEKLKSLAKDQLIELVVPYQLAALSGENNQLQEVIVSDLDGNKKVIKADILLPFFGLSMELGPINDWGLNLNHQHILVDIVDMKTNIEGIYAIGDVASYPGKLKLILTGFAEAAKAVYSCYSRSFPDSALHFEYSTTKGISSL